MNQIQILDGVEVNTAARINAHDTTPINHLDDMIESRPAPQPGVNADDAAPQPYVTRDAQGNVVIMLDGKVVGTLQKAAKLSYAKGLEAKFQAKRKQAYLDKQAKAI
jgi:hypothetical protein